MSVEEIIQKINKSLKSLAKNGWILTLASDYTVKTCKSESLEFSSKLYGLSMSHSS